MNSTAYFDCDGYASLKLTQTGSWLKVELCSPPMNLIDWQMLADLDQLSQRLQNSSMLKLVSVESALDHFFSAHADLRLFTSREAPPVTLSGPPVEIFRRFRRLPQLTVACVNGRAIGGGLELALSMDIVLATEKARLGFFEAHLGTVPGGGGTWATAERLGSGRSLLLLLGDDEIDASTAESFGLVDRVLEEVEKGKFMERLAARISGVPGPVIATTRELVTAYLRDRDDDAASRREAQAQSELAERLPGVAQARMLKFLDSGGQEEAWELYEMNDALPSLADDGA